jgi:HEAT repeat protein
MNDLLQLLRGGDLRSDGRADEVASAVLQKPELFEDLFAGLMEPEKVIRARTAHALERVSRSEPQLVAKSLRPLVATAARDEVPMVRWHLAMILANLVILDEQSGLIWDTLLGLLVDKSVYVRCWSIAGLTVFGKAYPSRREAIITRLEPLVEDPSKAVSNRASKAVTTLSDEGSSIPDGWLKGQS